MSRLISIIIPVYNLEEHLAGCLDSISAQTYSNFEVILVNDGSTDQSARICERYAESDQRIKIIHKPHQGVSEARNTGIGAAKGEYIGFIDGDDYIKPDMLEVLYTLSVKTESDIAVCKLAREVNGVIINEDHSEIYIKEMAKTEAIRELFKGRLYRFSLCNKLFKKSCFTDVEFPPGRIHEDLSTTYRIFANSNKTVFTNYAGYVYVKRPESILTSKYNQKRLDAFTGWREIMTFMEERYPDLQTEVTAGFGYWCVDNTFYILNQIDSHSGQKKYLSAIQQDVRHYYGRLLRNQLLSAKYKYILFLLNHHIGSLLLMNDLKKITRTGAKRKQLQGG